MSTRREKTRASESMYFIEGNSEAIYGKVLAR